MTRTVSMTVIAVVMGTSGCASWVPVAGPTPLPLLQIEAEIPDGWMAFVWAEGTYLTRDGEELQSIHLRRWPTTSVVKSTGRSVREGMLAQEVADLALDGRRLDDEVDDLRILSSDPRELDGRRCYRVEYAYRADTGLRRKSVEYGCVVGIWLYRFEYDAAAEHYFVASLDDFEALAGSLRFTLP